jgi:alkane 1-monooxygenase
MILQALLPFLFLASVPLAHMVSAEAPWLVLPGLFFTFITLDAWFGEPRTSPVPTGSGTFYRLPLWGYIPAQLAIILWGIATASRSGGASEFAALALSTGVMAGIFGMLAAHEMIHSRLGAERALGLAMLCGATYPHFRISHIYGHHRLAGTREDPATARHGENAYRFVLRSVAGQLAHAWLFERTLASARGRPVLANRMYRYLAIVAVLYGAVALGFGWRGVVFLLVESAVAIFILELFNYVAHYGLERRMTETGRVEKLGPNHSWNTAHWFNNLALFNGGHHTDHHRAPSAAYQNLRAQSGGPPLPAGFAGSIFLALVPPLWRRVMDPRVASRQGETAESADLAGVPVR